MEDFDFIAIRDVRAAHHFFGTQRTTSFFSLLVLSVRETIMEGGRLAQIQTRFAILAGWGEVFLPLGWRDVSFVGFSLSLRTLFCSLLLGFASDVGLSRGPPFSRFASQRFSPLSFDICQAKEACQYDASRIGRHSEPPKLFFSHGEETPTIALFPLECSLYHLPVCSEREFRREEVEKHITSTATPVCSFFRMNQFWFCSDYSL